jgi:hypothetical protein
LKLAEQRAKKASAQPKTKTKKAENKMWKRFRFLKICGTIN